MKKNLILYALCIVQSTFCLAQQALWDRAKVVSPEINADNTVTFRFFAPKAHEVNIVGDFIAPWKITTPEGETTLFHVPMKEEKGVWTWTTPEPLASELYSYCFFVDGIRMTDPANVYQIRDISTISSVFIVGGGQGDLYKVNNVKHGTVSRQWYHSDKLGMDRRLTVYTPAGYEQGKKRYPVFYLLHGMGGDEEAWMSLGRCSQILDNLIAQGKAEPMIMVMTNGNADLEAAPGESSLGMVPPTTALPKTMQGSFEEAFPEVVDFIDTHYRTIKKKESRAIAGLSMGGFHSLHISKQYPDMFNYVGLFSAAIMPHNNADSEIYKDMEGKLATQFAKKPALYWIAIGTDDFLYKANCDFRAILDKNHYPYTYRESGEGHIWKNWRVYLSEYATMLFK